MRIPRVRSRRWAHGREDDGDEGLHPDAHELRRSRAVRVHRARAEHLAGSMAAWPTEMGLKLRARQGTRSKCCYIRRSDFSSPIRESVELDLSGSHAIVCFLRYVCAIILVGSLAGMKQTACAVARAGLQIDRATGEHLRFDTATEFRSGTRASSRTFASSTGTRGPRSSPGPKGEPKGECGPRTGGKHREPSTGQQYLAAWGASRATQDFTRTAIHGISGITTWISLHRRTHLESGIQVR